MREGKARADTLADDALEEEMPLAFPWLASTHAVKPKRRMALVAPSGVSLVSQFSGLIENIAGEGHELICIAPAFSQSVSRILAKAGAASVPLPGFTRGVNPLGDPKSIYHLAKVFRELEPDIVAGYSTKAAAMTALAGKMARTEHIVSLIGELGRGFAEPPLRPSPVIGALQKAMLRLAFSLSDTAVFFNEENHKLLLRRKLVPQKLRQFPVQGAGVDLAEFPETPLPPLERGVMFLFAAPLDRRLGVADYCEAARILRTKSGLYRCLLAGPEVKGTNGFPLTELKRYREVVQYLGPQADARGYMARSHAFVLPAVGDVTPLPLIEAIALGRPVITTTSRGCRSIVSGGTNGMLVPPGDPAALASAMQRLLLRPDLIPAMARASRALAESRFDNRRINTQLFDALGL